MHQNISTNCLHQSKDRLEIISNILVCFKCSSLIIKDGSHKEISTIKPPQFSVIQENSIPIFFSLKNKKPYSFQNKKGYLKIRKSIIKKMKLFCSKFNLNKRTYFLALDYFDRISSKMTDFYLEEDIKQIAKYCIILASKFQENGEKGMEVKKFGAHVENNYVKDELFLLQLLDYDLHSFTCYDILMDILHCGFLFNGENFSINKMKAIYQKIENMLYMFSESNYYIDMSHKEISVVIIGFTREILGLEAYNNIIIYIFINDPTNIQNYLKYLSKLKKCFIIKEEENNNENTI